MDKKSGQKEKVSKKKHTNKRVKRQKKSHNGQRERPLKICTLCEKPHYSKTQLCVSCNRRFKQMKQQDERVSIVKLTTIQKDFPNEDIWKLIQEGRVDSAKPLGNRRPKMMANKRKVREAHRSDEYRQKFYHKEDTTSIPPFIFREMSRFPTRELIGISGERTNPEVYYVCIRCGDEQVIKYSDLERGHNCIATKSSGEAIVESYLKNLNIPFLTQYQTLLCKNPRTGYRLPYDIEIQANDLLIEVQGDQHYRYTPYFHGTKENFQYQKWKDKIKKNFAEKKGYRLLYLNYFDIKSGEYISKINEALEGNG